MNNRRLIILAPVAAIFALGFAGADQYGPAAWRQLKFLLTETCSSAGTCDLAAGTTVGGASITGPADNLGDHTATTTLDLDNNAITNIGDAGFEGVITQFPAVNTTTATSPTHVKIFDFKSWFNLDGEKFPVEGECVDLYSVGGPPQTSGTPDGLCDVNGYTVGTQYKTKAVGFEQEFVNLSETEGYAYWIKAFGGGDTDLIGINIDAYATGGAHASGDEGLSLYRGFAQDYYLTVSRTIGGALSAGAGTQTVTVGSLSEDESQVLGENKLAVFTGSGVAVSVLDAPPGTFSGGVLEDSGTIWSLTGSATGQGVWTLGADQVTSSAVKADSWCFSPTDSDYTDINGNASKIWLMISAIDAEADTITTRWENQGYDAKTPYPMIAGEDASAATTNEGTVAPCAVLGPPTFAGGVGDYVADSLTFVKGADFPAQSSGATFKVSSYPTLRLDGVRMNFAQKLGGMYPSDGFTWNSLLDGSANSGRFMGGAAVHASFSGSLSNLQDGEHHALEYGMDCDVTPGACKYGLGFRYSPDDSDVGFDKGTAIKITFGTDDWDDDLPVDVIAPYSTSSHQTSKDLTLDKTDGWGTNGTPFALTTGAHVAGNCAKWDASGYVVDAGAACGGGGGGSIATDTIWGAAGDLVYGTGPNTATRLAIGSTSQVLRVVGGVPAWGDIDIDFTSGDTSDDDDLDVAAGGTGVSTLTSNGVLLGNGASDVTATSAGTNGQVLIGQTGSAPAFTTIGTDATLSAAGALTIASNAVALGTDTTNAYVATIADSGAAEVTVSGSGSESAAVTLALASGITRDIELHTHTDSTASPVNGTNSCAIGDSWWNYSLGKFYLCKTAGSPAGSVWYGIQMVASP